MSPAKTSNGNVFDYDIDAQNRRVVTRENSGIDSRFVYRNKLRVSLETTGNGTVKNYYVYDKKPNVPEYFYRRGNDTNYRIITDHIGSVKVVLNSNTGGIAQLTQYGDLGTVLSRTNENLQPFGFGGGIYDKNTGLVKFGARDYDPETGRWLTKDPIQFSGGDFNLYGYTLQDPVNLVDPNGKAVPLLIAAGLIVSVASVTGILGGINAEKAGGSFGKGFSIA